MECEAKFWNGIAAGYARSKISDEGAYRHTLERTRSYISGRAEVLELGCGTGATAAELAPDVGRITVSDIAPAMLDLARARGVANMRCVLGDAFAPELAGRYDAVLAFNLLHLLRERTATLAQIRALMAPGGLFISKTVCRPERGFPLKYHMMMALVPLLQRIGKAPFVKVPRIAELEQQVCAAGFEIIEQGNFPAQPPRRYLVARAV